MDYNILNHRFLKLYTFESDSALSHCVNVPTVAGSSYSSKDTLEEMPLFWTNDSSLRPKAI